MRHLSFRAVCALALSVLAATQTLSAERLPARLQGTWRIARVLPTTNSACWGRAQAEPLVGSTLTYRESAMRWRGGEVALEDITTRRITEAEFREENNSGSEPVSFGQIGIHAPAVLEIDLQHEDMDITGATTEVPGDSVLLAGPNRIIVQACGVFFEAMRTAAVARTSFRR